MEAADSLDSSTDNQETVRAWSANEEITSSHPILATNWGYTLVLSFVQFNVFKSTETSNYVAWICLLTCTFKSIRSEIPSFLLVQPQHSAWVTSSDKLLAQSRVLRVSALAHCFRDEELPGEGNWWADRARDNSFSFGPHDDPWPG